MTDAPTPLDLDAIVAAIAECRTYNFGMYQADRLHEHAPALVEEVKRLRADVALLRPALAQLEEAFEEESDAHDALKAEVARLTARPAPAWDEEATAEAVRKDLEAAGILPWTNGGARIVRTALAVIREHLPVKPSREAMGAAIRHALKTRTGAHFGLSEYDLADVALSLLPGRPEAEVKAEALREAADEWHAEHYGTRPAAYKFLWDRADRLAAEGGAS